MEQLLWCEARTEVWKIDGVCYWRNDICIGCLHTERKVALQVPIAIADLQNVTRETVAQYFELFLSGNKNSQEP